MGRENIRRYGMLKMYTGVVIVSVVLSGFMCGCDRESGAPQKEPVVEQKPVAEEKVVVSQKTDVKEKVVETKSPVIEKKAVETPAWIKEFFGDKLILADGSEVSADVLAGKTVGIYFSAHWCPPCRGFTPVLVKAYNELQKDGKSFDLVFVSSDRSPEEMKEYMTSEKMPWKALPFNSGKKRELASKYGLIGIPTLIVVDSNGKLISSSGRVDVVSKGAAAFDDWQKK
jgi:thiol-disulfide isomerase/thioredoxin